MSEPATTEPAQQTTTTPADTGQQDFAQQNEPAKFAGKFETPEALEQGYHSIREKLNLPKIEGKPLFGSDGVFSSVTTAEQGYKDLEAMIGRPPATTEPAPGEETPLDTLKVEPPEPSDPFEAVQQELASKGMDEQFQKTISETWVKDGKLTDEQYQTLQEKGGYSKAVVNAHMAALASVAQTTATTQQTQVATAIDKASQTVGGDEKLKSLLNWAGTHFPEAEQADLNRRLADPTLLQSAVEQIASAHRTAVGAGRAQALLDNTQVAGSVPAITTPKEFQDMRRRAQQGDKQATAALLKLDDNQFAALATTGRS